TGPGMAARRGSWSSAGSVCRPASQEITSMAATEVRPATAPARTPRQVPAVTTPAGYTNGSNVPTPGLYHGRTDVRANPSRGPLPVPLAGSRSTQPGRRPGRLPGGVG